MVAGAGDAQRRLIVLIRPVDLRAFVQQQPRRVDVAVLARVIQNRTTLFVRPIWIGAVLET